MHGGDGLKPPSWLVLVTICVRAAVILDTGRPGVAWAARAARDIHRGPSRARRAEVRRAAPREAAVV
jgi:hypothetical protein